MKKQKLIFPDYLNFETFFIYLLFFFQHTIDEVENLIKKHEAFEKSAAAQEERFGALERLTTVSAHLFFHVKYTLV